MPCVGVDIPLGSIREQRLVDILQHQVFCDLKNFRKTIKGPCASCEKSAECYGCRGAAYQMTGDYLASDPTCWRNRDESRSRLLKGHSDEEFNRIERNIGVSGTSVGNVMVANFKE